jgi:glucose-6-phosphate 1-dehydrogenase
VSVATASSAAASPATQIPKDQVIVLFGATGDLAKRKLLPGMFHLTQVGLMPERFRIVGTARTEIELDEFRELAREAVEASSRRSLDAEAWQRFAESLRFAGVGDGFDQLGEAVDAAREELGGDPSLLFYLSLPPRAASGTVEQIGEAGLGRGARVITEKPFGTDLDSARQLNSLLHSVFDENCIYRIDHYLGREAVQNLLALRFANGMFEPVWNRNHIDHVQIDIPETLSIEMRGRSRSGSSARRSSNRCRRSRPTTSSAASTTATAVRRGLPPIPTPRPSSRSRRASTTGAGRGSRSICAAASGWRRTATC